MAYRPKLLRDNTDYPKESRDPEKILGRMEHFWSGHGRLGEHMMSPHDHAIRNKSFTEWHEVDDNDVMSNYPTRGFESWADLQWEGSVSSPIAHLNRHFSDTDQFHKIDEIRNSEWDAKAHLSPITNYLYTRRGPLIDQSKPTALRVSSGRNTMHSPETIDIGTPSDPKSFNKEYSEAVTSLLRKRVNHIIKLGESGSPAASLVRSKPGESVPQIEKTYRERYAGDLERFRQREPAVFDPRYVRIEKTNLFGRGRDSTEDYIDLSTGTWAKISPDQFFPH